MKRSDVVEHIKREMAIAIQDLKYVEIPLENYLNNISEGILNMLLGFGMLPPGNIDYYKFNRHKYAKVINYILTVEKSRIFEWDETLQPKIKKF